MGTVFVLFPLGLIALNEALGWPRWQSGVGRAVGGGLMLAGIGVVLHCSSLFTRVGAGTPVPTEPPKHLVATGFYRYSRNPIYVADIAVLLGLFLHRGEVALLLYALAFAAAAHGWVVWHEEPELRARFGDDFVRYAEGVPRWIAWRAAITGRPTPEPPAARASPPSSGRRGRSGA